MPANIDKALFLMGRHGTTKLNEEGVYRGWANDEDATLDREGEKQARIAGRFLSKQPIKIGLIISSDLDRALHTAAIIGNIILVDDIHIDPRLRPLNVGDYEGLDKKENPITYYQENPDEVIPGGESINGFRNRQADFSNDLMEWIENNPDEMPLISAHLSNMVYWEDLKDVEAGHMRDYAKDREDIVRPGGIIAGMPDKSVVALLGENKRDQATDEGGE